MDGYQAAEAIRKKEKGTGKHLPIIALTAYEGAEHIEKAKEAGMDLLLINPSRPGSVSANRKPLTSRDGGDKRRRREKRKNLPSI